MGTITEVPRINYTASFACELAMPRYFLRKFNNKMWCSWLPLKFDSTSFISFEKIIIKVKGNFKI